MFPEERKQWSPAAHARYERIMASLERTSECRYRLGDDAPVPRWLRDATDGLLAPPEVPSLQFGRVWGRVDWPALLAEHGDDLVVAGTVGSGGPHWEGVSRAWRILEDAGHLPELDVDLEVGKTASLELTHGGICTGSSVLPSDETVLAVHEALQVACMMAWPESRLLLGEDPETGLATPRFPIEMHDSCTETIWIWAVLRSDEVPPIPA